MITPNSEPQDKVVDPLIVAKNVLADKSTGYVDAITKNILAQAVLNKQEQIEKLENKLEQRTTGAGG